MPILCQLYGQRFYFWVLRKFLYYIYGSFAFTNVVASLQTQICVSAPKGLISTKLFHQISIFYSIRILFMAKLLLD